MKHWLSCLAALLIIAAPDRASSTQSPAASVPGPIAERAERLLPLLNGEGTPADQFAPAFLAQVPAEQVTAITGQYRSEMGRALRVQSVRPETSGGATIVYAYERGTATMRMVVEASPPHLITQLLVIGTERSGDNADAIVRELQQLPGQVGFAVARLDGAQPALIAAHQPDRALAIGSTFKLIVLAELSRQVREGRRRWSDAVTIDRHSLPSGLLQDWPLGSPVTLHTLASLMISRSDNTATDVLMRLLGRENVEAMMTRMGMASASRNLPFLTTMELFQLKADEADARARWIGGDETARRRLLRERYEEGGALIDLARLSTAPTAIDSVEWFASASDLVRVMDWLRRNGDETAHGIMAIGPGLARSIAGEFGYVGFKGGSEPGVINLTYLIRNNAGVWHVVTGGWNNPAAAVDEAAFLALIARAVRLVR